MNAVLRMSIALLSCSALLLLPPSSHAQIEPESALEKLTPCYLENISEQVLCGYLSVPENYQQPDAATIDIHYAVLPAVSEGKRNDPLLILAGGPGQAAIELAAGIDGIFKELRNTRDILLIDQRGTGQSGPLSCAIDQIEDLAKPDEELELAAMTKQCLAQYADRDLTQYHSVNAIRDFDAVRAHLGYDQVNLYGGSYGSRAGLVYMREFPQSIRSAILDAVAPVQVVVGLFGRHGADSFALLLKNCAADPGCSKEFPELATTYATLLQQLEENPVPMTVNDPLSNQEVDVMFTAGRLTSVIRMGLYHPNMRRMLPYIVNEAAQENYQPLLGMMGGMMGQSPLYIGLTLSVLCSEDLARATPAQLAADGANDFIGSRTADAFIEMCSSWPTAARPASWFEPVSSDIPTLLLSGELDPVTPAAWAEQAAESLSNSRHLVAPYGSHTIIGHTCANRLATQFVDNLDLASLDDSCLTEAKPRPFVLNENGRGL